jgi:hypothetical protein
MEQKINSDIKKMSYIWWWRGGNNHIERFELIDDFLYINHWKIRVNEIYIQKDRRGQKAPLYFIIILPYKPVR